VPLWLDKSAASATFVTFTACSGFTRRSFLSSIASMKFFISNDSGSAFSFFGFSVPLFVSILIS